MKKIIFFALSIQLLCGAAASGNRAFGTHIKPDMPKTMVGLLLMQMDLDERLQDAIIRGRLPHVKYLIEQGANPKTESLYGYRPMDVAVGFSRYEIVEFLVQEHGVSVNESSIIGGIQQTPLHLAVRQVLPHMICLLLRHGADRQLADGENRTPFELAECEKRFIHPHQWRDFKEMLSLLN